MAGKQGNIWYFGEGSGLDFNTLSGGHPTELTDGIISTVEGVATISDGDGKLLFYTDGIDVMSPPSGGGTHEILTYDATDLNSRVYITKDKTDGEYQGDYWDTHPTKPNNATAYLWGDYSPSTFAKSTGLFGDWSSAQSAVIVPQPLSDQEIVDGWREPYRYFIFTVPARTGSFFQNYYGNNPIVKPDWDSLDPFGTGVNNVPQGTNKYRRISYCRGKRSGEHGALHYSVIDLRYNTAADVDNTSFDKTPDTNGKPRGVGVIVKRNRPVGYGKFIDAVGTKTNVGVKYQRVAENIAATQADDGSIWVASKVHLDHNSNLPGVQLTKVTTNGVQANSENTLYTDGYSYFSKSQSYGHAADTVGYMRFSPDGAKLGVTRASLKGEFIVLDFNTTTGVLSNPKSIAFNSPLQSTSTDHSKFQGVTAYGLEITYDSTVDDYIYYLTITTYKANGYPTYGHKSVIAIRHDVFGYGANINTNDTTFQASSYKTNFTKILKSAGLNHQWALQLASNGKIYVSIREYGTTNRKLSSITNPKSWSTVTYDHESVTLTSGNIQLGFPTFMSSFFNACAAFNIKVTGSTDTTTVGGSDGIAQAGAYGATGTTNYQWFDGANNDTGITTRVVSTLSAGTYTVSGNTILEGNTCTSTANIIIGEPSVYGSSTYLLCETGADMAFGSATGGGVYYDIVDMNGEPITCVKVTSGILSDPKPTYELTDACCEIDVCDKMIEFKFSCKEEEKEREPEIPKITCFNECENHYMYDYKQGSTDMTNTSGSADKAAAIAIINQLNAGPEDTISLEFIKHFDVLDITEQVIKNWNKIFVDGFSDTESENWVVGCNLCPPNCDYYFIGGYAAHQSLPSSPDCSTPTQAYTHNSVWYDMTKVDKFSTKLPVTSSSLAIFTTHGLFEQNTDYAEAGTDKVLDFTKFTEAQINTILSEGIVFFEDSNGCLCVAKTSNFIILRNNGII